MIKLYLIRHGKTRSNIERRYLGLTDEPLCSEGRLELKEAGIKVDAVYASPMKRCLETAAILFPGVDPVVIDDLKEIDFGDFEGKNYIELSDNPDYQAFVDSGATLPFPGGESREEFQERCVNGFKEALLDLKAKAPAGDAGAPGDAVESGLSAAFVVHGGTIMSILSEFADPKEDYFYWQAANGEGFACTHGEGKDGGIRLYDIQYLGSDSGDPS